MKFQKAFLQSNQNFNQMVNSMVVECGKKCFSNLKSDILTEKENICVVNCQGKYFELFNLCDQYTANMTSKLMTLKKNADPLTFIQENELKF